MAARDQRISPAPTMRDAVRLWGFCDRSGGDDAHWRWLGARTSTGYGITQIGGINTSAHRAIFRAFVGELSNDDDVDHRFNCGPIGCVNPRHLRPLSRRENVMRGNGACAIRGRSATCPSGHFYDGEMAVGTDGIWRRRCVRCVEDRRSRRHGPRPEFAAGLIGDLHELTGGRARRV
ncbi:HNH endonuclease family protein [Fodinicola feengrottensis]|uniref:HNH nuclease domain-containing protein n=1 Tax=Fodinicola feengrottensis TaxID=435914 RepID=A0ABN2IVC6_9ACTN|nr:hypothetical protein [Fodinicola feengrottensis]